MRTLTNTLTARPASDGAGVAIHRVSDSAVMNPFLMLDEINSDQAADYLAGFPEHPHRGFETITYMKAGRMRHRDHMGNEGVIDPGGVQWMSAGRGVVHSEMPEQDSGLLHGFQIWLNLPGAEKMNPADYQDIPQPQLARGERDGVYAVAVVAGDVALDGRTLTGPLPQRSTQPVLMDVELEAGAHIELAFAPQHEALVYVYAGGLDNLERRQLGVFAPGEALVLEAGPAGAGALVLSGAVIDEPIVQYGPFVMNSREEIEQALQDFAAGRLTG